MILIDGTGSLSDAVYERRSAVDNPDPERKVDEADVAAGEQLQPARWYFVQGEQRNGPLSLADMRRFVLNGTIAPETFVWADGMSDWLPAARVPALVPPPEWR